MKTWIQVELEKLLQVDDAVHYSCVEDFSESVVQDLDEDRLSDEDYADVNEQIEVWWSYNEVDKAITERSEQQD